MPHTSPCSLRIAMLVLCLALVALAAPASHASVSIGVGFSTGRAGFGFATYAPLYVFDYAYTRSHAVFHSNAVAIHRSQGRLRKSPRAMYRAPRAIVPRHGFGYGHAPLFRGRSAHPPRHLDHGPTPGYHGHDGFPHGRHRRDWESRTPFAPRNGPPLFGERYERHFYSAPIHPPVLRPPYPYRSIPQPRAYRSPYRNPPRVWGRFRISP